MDNSPIYTHELTSTNKVALLSTKPLIYLDAASFLQHFAVQQALITSEY